MSEFFDDPHPVYANWREKGGAHPAADLPGGLEGWVITGYAESRAALADPRLRKGAANEVYLNRSGGGPGTGGALTAHMLNSDPPDHTRLRKLVQKAFTARRVAALRPRIEEIADALLADLDGRDEVDLVESYALPLPIAVICELLGVPDGDRVPFRDRGERMAAGDDREAMFAALRTMAAYLGDLVRAKREAPADDLLSALVQAQEDDDRLSDQEITSMAFLLLVAGNETTVGLIATGVHTLLAHPERLAAVRADPALLPAAVEEFLRHDGPVNLATLRYTAEPVKIGDTVIPEGEFVHIALTAANRDPAAYPDPDRFDPARDTSGHLAFGHGIHYCLGAPLARLEAEIALSRLLPRFPGLRPAAPATWQDNLRFRALATLPVRLR